LPERRRIPLLAKYFIERYARSTGKKIKSVDKKTLELLQAYDWPGNIRELQNMIERAVILCDGATLSINESSMLAKPSRRFIQRLL
jgi:DNA-binding NtrC family response regulator